jgi:SAM-dependent methyltransferase
MNRPASGSSPVSGSTPVTQPASAENLENHLGGEDARNYRQYEFDMVAPWCGRSLLEIGSGLGDFSDQFEGRLDRLVVSDNDQYCVSELKKRYQGREDVEVLQLALPCHVPVSAPVDTVIAMNVLEHIEDDVKALECLSDALVPGGRVVVWVPGYQQLYGDFDRKVGHVRRYTPATLSAAVRNAGLEVESCKPINFLGGIAWWLAVRKGGTGYPNPRLVRVYDRVVVPLTRLIEKAVTPPFGQTVLCVARRPAE